MNRLLGKSISTIWQIISCSNPLRYTGLMGFEEGPSLDESRPNFTTLRVFTFKLEPLLDSYLHMHTHISHPLGYNFTTE